VQPDYFVNHARASKFPWSIYHRPLEKHLATFLEKISRTSTSSNPTVLVLGGGYLHELPELPSNLRLTVVDIDDRVTGYLKNIQDDRLERSITIRGPADIRGLGPFDAVYAKEVIEHIVDVDAYVGVLAAVLKPGGVVWLSTPNYGDPWLPLIESTILEMVGRLSGYSRKNMHPTRFAAESLQALLDRSGLQAIQVAKTPFRLALVGTARKPSR
jgi:2-polyprenyl-3-methyl-5-hydroxy-6-metoxy-1,4-benzoquinol methylase